MSSKRIVVTGGAGFIGSHMVDALMKKGERVLVLDNLSTGKLENLKRWIGDPKFKFERTDISKSKKLAMKNVGKLFHFAANPDVRIGSADPNVHFRQNIEATRNILEAVRRGDVEHFVFASSSTVYGNAAEIPTPEDYAPLKPVSVYGASKLASEALVSAYAETYSFRATIYRMANIIGARSEHGVIYDFVRKLRKNPKELEILGDGKQSKSYLYVSDCVDGILLGAARSKERVDVFNIGSCDEIGVVRIADIVCRQLNLKNVRYKFKPVTKDGGGWPGDVKKMRLNVLKLEALGWNPRMDSEQAVIKSVRDIVMRDGG